MDDESPDVAPVAPDAAPAAAPKSTGNHRRLNGWKETAAYLGCGETTAQRWEKEEGLPIHRLLHSKKGPVYAHPSELDTWVASRDRPPQTPDRETPSAVEPGRHPAAV